MVVEIDGSSQHKTVGCLKDMNRDGWFRSNGYEVIHINNEDVWSFQKEDMFKSDKNGIVVEEDGFPAYLPEFLDSLLER